MNSEIAPRLIGAGTALPPNYVDQEHLTARLRELWQARYSDLRRFDQIQGALGITGRHLALPIEAYIPLDTFAKTNRAWMRVAPEVGTAAARAALNRAGLEPRDVDHLFFVTVTGIATPSIDTRVISALGMRKDVKRTPIFGLGCVAGATGMARTSDYVRAFPNDVSMLLSIELCSLTLQREDLSIANIIASGLFGDGSAAMIFSGNDRAGGKGPQVIATRSLLFPNTEEILGWEVVDSGFKIVLSSKLTDLVAAHIRDEVDSFLAAQNLERANIRHWIAHAGGPKVLRTVESSLELPEGALARSWKSLESVGNLSSASVMFTLTDLIDEGAADPGDYGMVIGMGPGFSVELVLLKW
ncbi:MAG: 3-oxoacyl-[acyl-carrier-protein] synthase III C-terminal domain-containing protein [Candidatus Binatus sp.]|uniref:type III polyketide synthase n=1 Tax=Candidatus Binatus sp. TaxID=2811406 RepID=UPI002727F585|nr:3-oxoacyl-[acyl-carrier-protein] synthase III C-terminal domain-containing protein [Candidatus Binatus sp.]MDO8431556.1 3-oxoacyl-[acyl-carrier-protein] synthase III C-terminal domain-containing protein [Candidatus Binatus sp.]